MRLVVRSPGTVRSDELWFHLPGFSPFRLSVTGVRSARGTDPPSSHPDRAGYPLREKDAGGTTPPCGAPDRSPMCPSVRSPAPIHQRVDVRKTHVLLPIGILRPNQCGYHYLLPVRRRPSRDTFQVLLGSILRLMALVAMVIHTVFVSPHSSITRQAARDAGTIHPDRFHPMIAVGSCLLYTSPSPRD